MTSSAKINPDYPENHSGINCFLKKQKKCIQAFKKNYFFENTSRLDEISGLVLASRLLSFEFIES